jgi:hypothetical protein
MGHVVSRAFGGGDDVALAPLIDSCNHRHGAGKPWPLVLGDNNESGSRVSGVAPESSGGGSSSGDDGLGVLVCVTPEVDGEVQGLEAGEELCITYGSISGGGRSGDGGGGESALSVYTSFGFVPDGVDLQAEV